MNKLVLDDVYDYVEKNISIFHQKRFDALSHVNLKRILKRKNPYLFKVKNLLTSESIVRGFLDAYISSSEEGIFGNWLEGLAIYINSCVYAGWKSGIPGIDLEFDKEDVRYLVSIKSGPNWANSSQIKKIEKDFSTAKKSVRTSNSGINVIAVMGCCYGQDNHPDKEIYFKYCGQQFWEFISGDTDLFTKLIEPLGTNAKTKNEEFLQKYSMIVNKFTIEFSADFCKDTGEIDWEQLVRFNSQYKNNL